MTVKEFIEWLQTQDQGATVEIIEHLGGIGYYDQGGTVFKEIFDPGKHSDYSDLRGNQFIKAGAPYFETRTLLLGSIDG